MFPSIGGLYLQLCVVGAVLRPVHLDPTIDDPEDLFNDKELVKITEEAAESGSFHNHSTHKVANGHLSPALHVSVASHVGSVGRVSPQSYLGSVGHVSRESGLSNGSLAYPGVMGSAVDVMNATHTSNRSLVTKRVFDGGKGAARNKHITSLFDLSLKNNISKSCERMTCSEYDLDRGSMPRSPEARAPSTPQVKVTTKTAPPTSPSPSLTVRMVRTPPRIRTTSECSQADTIPDSMYSSHVGPLDTVSEVHDTDTPHRTRCNRFTSFCSSEMGLLTNPTFVLYCIMNLLVCIGVSLAYQHLPDYVLLYGTTREGTASLLSLIGISNCASRFITGLAINNEQIDPILVQLGSNGVVGIVFLFMPLLVQSYEGQATFAVMFGFYANCYVALLGPITIKIAGLENLSHAYGILLILCGLGFLVGPPVAGTVHVYNKNI